MNDKKLPFLETIYHLRTVEHLILYSKLLVLKTQEEKEVVELLRDEYDKEKLHYPFTAPAFDEKAALWGSKIVYFAAQLFLNRSDTAKDLDTLLPAFNNTISASAMLSADLCLRFLPQILGGLRNTDAEDVIIPILEKHLADFHYANIGYEHRDQEYEFSLFENQCFKQLYLNRITTRQDKYLAKVPEINALLMSNFGNYKKDFWKDLDIVTTH